MTFAYRAPGRVNLIGEHTDYNDGFVMPVAIDRATTATMTPRPDRTVVVQSGQAPSIAFDLDQPGSGPSGSWSDYLRGTAAILERRGHRLRGADIAITSDVPAGAGLSSSAALEVSIGFGLLDLAGAPIDLTELALACQQAEHEFVGTRCGIMDQFIACHGRAGHALLIDTRSLRIDALPIPDGVRVLICNSMTRHAHASGEYNHRRSDCESGVRSLQGALPDVRALRDVTSAQLEESRARLDARVYRRCRHVVTENERVLHAAEALTRGDLRAFGALMDASHASMRDDYEISTPSIDALVDAARACHGVYGARLTGGGFGGCVVALVDAPAVASVAEQIRGGYATTTGRVADIYPCAASDGVRRIA
ncbi:MAG TPA: galactokinase [Vicinamibacterales bacterium]|jgi:galactokinase